ncbi:hypothetical protein PK35_11660 [Tamlana nanhaiensis]|uniref:Glycosyltransferase 2-like domain-containing protein n=1 Tax=Neotamlana nanhaiensis TaxID=1382798 RepID=A0A0D7W2K8_9FLAO|nr:glycosyltransferase family A protein [Tamlana nanhaiensis]KJD32087.1 hypothetical protein PK35_10775 [Tamlana nanhaiensis]KJD32249.1 hypothetical protein PK35_11660 [Tamlana nanhaiensis]
MSFFSVIIPLYNKEKYIEATLNSVLNQEFKDFEIIIFDDGSTDDSLKQVEAFSDSRILIIKEINQGVSAARNKSIELAKGKYIALLDADDIWEPNHLTELHKLITLFPEAGLYCNNYRVFYNSAVSRPAKFNFQYAANGVLVNDFFKASIINCVAWTSSVCFAKNTFTEIGGFKPHLKTSQDLDLWIRFALKHQVAFNPKITMSYKQYVSNSLSKNESHYNEIRYNFISSFSEFEKTNTSLKLYLDINRYAVSLRALINNNKPLYKKLKQEIDFKNLNFKQKILINTPKVVLKLLKKLQISLIKMRVYLTAFD